MTVQPRSTTTRDAAYPTASADACGRSTDSGLWALTSVARHWRIYTDHAVIGHRLALGGRPALASDIVRAAAMIGLKGKVYQTEASHLELERLPHPAILQMQTGQFVVLSSRHASLGDVLTHDGSYPQRQPTEQLAAQWSGLWIALTRRHETDSSDARFGLQWFVPMLWRYRRPIAHIAAASFFVQLFALVTPVFFQAIIDRVLIHNAIATLYLVAVGLLVVGLFDVLLQYLRTYAISHTAARIDVELSSRIFRHLLDLPLGYFETNPTGQIVARVREMDTIRGFLTGQGLMSLMDVLFAVLFIAVLAAYSIALTLVVLLSIPIYTLIIIVIRPRLRQRSRERFARNADSQQVLVETVVGAQTIKAAAIEPLAQVHWDERRAAFAKTAFQASMLASLVQNSIQYVSKVGTATILFLGASAVMRGEMTVGQLVAFNMIAAQVVLPILRLAQFWQELQQVQVSIARLGDIMQTPPESEPDALADLPPVRGSISLRNVSFRYTPDAPLALKDISLDIPRGTGHRRGRPVGLRQIDPEQADAAALPASARPDHDRWRRSGARASRLDPSANRRRAAGKPAVQSHHPREHRAGSAARDT
jgi:subfamily B ATP-binding cassette protein HlyB/CyaB